jgi:Phage integrase, N-terminal SAM-like domain
MPRARRDATPGAGRPVKGSVDVRPFKNGADASFWLRIMIDGRRVSRRLGLASEGWTPVLAEAERRRVVAEIQAGIYREPAEELPLEERDPTFHVWASRWLDMRTGEIEPKTFEHYEYLLRCHLLPALHGYRLTDLTYRVVDEFKKRKGRRDAQDPGRDQGRCHAVPRERLADEAVAEDDQPRHRPALSDPRRGRARRRARHQG